MTGSKVIERDVDRATGEVQYKFQRLDVYQMALEYLDRIYELTKLFPPEEKYNLTSQLHRAGTSIVLNIAEGSTGQSDAEQNRFLGLSMRSYLETVAAFDIARRRGYLSNEELVGIRGFGHQLFTKLQSFRRSLKDGPVPGPRSPVIL
ncbi:MAG TPA: four helix bundle protein [Pyrinomonadaceae bacterium]|nr:four helix bundle protein [Pyrinomonadaceae bacterium]